MSSDVMSKGLMNILWRGYCYRLSAATSYASTVLYCKSHAFYCLWFIWFALFGMSEWFIWFAMFGMNEWF